MSTCQKLAPWLGTRCDYESYCFSVYKGDSLELFEHKECLPFNINKGSMLSSTNNYTSYFDGFLFFTFKCLTYTHN